MHEVQLPEAEGMLDYSDMTEILSRSIECHVTFSRLDFTSPSSSTATSPLKPPPISRPGSCQRGREKIS
jgi:hypothetical protein